jgi:hypothetical protein
MWEKFIIWYNYRGVEDLVPANSGLFEGTPVSEIIRLLPFLLTFCRLSTKSFSGMYVQANATMSEVTQSV